MNLPKVEIYTDGGCEPNPGAGGYAAVLIFGEKVKEVYGSVPDTTNNRMEMAAAIEGLRALKCPCSVRLYSDSQLVIETMKGNFSRRKNQDLWLELDQAAKGHEIEWIKVKGHAGNKWNERCHDLAELGILGEMSA